MMRDALVGTHEGTLEQDGTGGRHVVVEGQDWTANEGTMEHVNDLFHPQ
jgi:hypothetical protein